VATIRKRGYRVLVPVRFVDVERDAPVAQPAAPPTPALGDVEVVAALAERWYAGGRRTEDLLPQGRLLAHATALADERGSAMSRQHARFVRRSRRQAIVRSSILVCMSSTILSLSVCVLLALLDGRRAAGAITAVPVDLPGHDAATGTDDARRLRPVPALIGRCRRETAYVAGRVIAPSVPLTAALSPDRSERSKRRDGDKHPFHKSPFCWERISCFWNVPSL
jgi:hypothetical protein